MPRDLASGNTTAHGVARSRGYSPVPVDGISAFPSAYQLHLRGLTRELPLEWLETANILGERSESGDRSPTHQNVWLAQISFTIDQIIGEKRSSGTWAGRPGIAIIVLNGGFMLEVHHLLRY